MQNRSDLTGVIDERIEILDPLMSNENTVVLRKIKALTASHPGVTSFEASRSYKLILDSREYIVALTKPLKLELDVLRVDLKKLESLPQEEKTKFAIFLNHLKQYSISTKERLYLQKDFVDADVNHLFAFEDESNTVIFRYVRLTEPLVVYSRKKDLSDRRFSVFQHPIQKGSYGSVFASNRSLSCSLVSGTTFNIKDKSAKKRRVVKVQTDKWSREFGEFIAVREYEMTSKLAPELAVKPLVKHSERKLSALLLRYLPGTDLFELVVANEVKSHREKLEICLAVANALKSVHVNGGVHRDVKPDNVIIFKNDDGQYAAQFVDYGLSVLQTTRSQTITGALIYIAPEIYLGGSASVASDVYSLCRVFESVFGYFPSWDREDNQICRQNCMKNVSKPFDLERSPQDASMNAYLKELGWNSLLDSMRVENAENRIKLDEVIDQLKSLIKAFKTKNESQPAISSAAAAAETNQESENCAHNKSSLRP